MSLLIFPFAKMDVLATSVTVRCAVRDHSWFAWSLKCLWAQPSVVAVLAGVAVVVEIRANWCDLMSSLALVAEWDTL